METVPHSLGSYQSLQPSRRPHQSLQLSRPPCQSLQLLWPPCHSQVTAQVHQCSTVKGHHNSMMQVRQCSTAQVRQCSTPGSNHALWSWSTYAYWSKLWSRSSSPSWASLPLNLLRSSTLLDCLLFWFYGGCDVRAFGDALWGGICHILVLGFVSCLCFMSYIEVLYWFLVMWLPYPHVIMSCAFLDFCLMFCLVSLCLIYVPNQSMLHLVFILCLFPRLCLMNILHLGSRRQTKCCACKSACRPHSPVLKRHTRDCGLAF